MKVNGKEYRSLWFDPDFPDRIFVIDQQRLPFSFLITELTSADDVFLAIRNMVVRGAPVIGAAAAWGLYLASMAMNSGKSVTGQLQQVADYLAKARPTAVNLKFALTFQINRISRNMSAGEITAQLKTGARIYSGQEVEACRSIGMSGLPIIQKAAEGKMGQSVNILTHCNAGWLACIDYGTALAPVYLAAEKGIPVHVWVDETRPRNQGALLTMWELQKAGIPCTLIADNTGGHLMQHGMVDLVLVGSDRTTRTGDVANKIGTYLKALAALDNRIPFYVALPSSTIDFDISDGIKDIPVEERSPEEVLSIRGLSGKEDISVRIAPENARAANYGFDVTPARLVTGLITERGICEASEKGLKSLFPDLMK
ncbi:MAG: S-methyl-5-thioribose-1-phosphate isomerase [Chlorobi bacterium]|nr:S-methyl-5-thioribose-1-phosphate isomerase [Chlorobiota bacterium]